MSHLLNPYSYSYHTHTPHTHTHIHTPTHTHTHRGNRIRQSAEERAVINESKAAVEDARRRLEAMNPVAIAAIKTKQAAYLVLIQQADMVKSMVSQVGVICHVIELDKMRLFIYIPYAKDQIWTFNLVYSYPDWSFCYLTYNVFSFYGLSYSMTYDMTPLRGCCLPTTRRV
jgi:hypothetical protein